MGSCTPFKTKFWLKHPSSYLATRFIPGVGPREPTECSLSPAPALLPRGENRVKENYGQERVCGGSDGGEKPGCQSRWPTGRWKAP